MLITPGRHPKVAVKRYCLFLSCRGMTPEDAELQYLDNARKLPLYGIDLHQAAGYVNNANLLHVAMHCQA